MKKRTGDGGGHERRNNVDDVTVLRSYGGAGNTRHGIGKQIARKQRIKGPTRKKAVPHQPHRCLATTRLVWAIYSLNVDRYILSIQFERPVQ